MAGISKLVAACAIFSFSLALGCAGGWKGPRPPVEKIPAGPEDVAASTGPPAVEQWSHKANAFLAGPPSAIGRFVVTADRKGRLQFLDPNSGKNKAELKGKGAICRPLSWDAEQLYVVSMHAGKSLQCFSFKQGKLVWHRKYRQPPEAPIRSGAELWLPYRDTIYALDPHTGLTQRVVLAGGDLWLSPVAWDSNFVVLGRHGTLKALNRTGALLWTADVGYTCAEPPALVGDTLWVVTTSGSVVQVASDGAVIQEKKLDSTALFTPVVGTQKVCVGASSGNVWMLNRYDGSTIWQRALTVPLSGAPVLHDEWLAATCVDGHLELLSADQGASLETVKYESILPFSPVWAFGRLYVVDSERKLHALAAP